MGFSTLDRGSALPAPRSSSSSFAALRLAGLFAACATLTGLAACGGGGGSLAPPPAPAPAPAPSPAPAPGTPPSANCLDTSQYTNVGLAWSLDYLKTLYPTPTTPTTSAVHQEWRVAPATIFNGAAVSELDLTSGNFVTRQYVSAVTPTSITINGSVSTYQLANNNTSETVVTYSPPAADSSAGLTAGQSFTQVFNATNQISANGMPQGAPTTTSTTQTTTYVGTESITVPAGTFPGACKFQTIVATGDPATAPTTTYWVIRYRGASIPLKTAESSGSSPVSQMELSSGSVAGVAITP